MERPLLLALTTSVLLFNMNALGATERIVTFEELPNLIRERNENVGAAEALQSASKARTGYFGRSFLPQISAQAGTESFNVTGTETQNKNYWVLTGRVNLYRGGRDRLENRIRDSNAKLAANAYTGEINNELKEARTAYWRLLALSKTQADKRLALENNETYIRTSRRRAGVGVSTNADTLEFELQKTLLEQDLKKLVLEEDVLKNQLSVAIGIEHEGLRVAGEFPHPPENQPSSDQDLSQTLPIERLRTLKETSDLQRTQAQRWWLPSVDLYSKYGVPNLDDEYERAIRQDKEFSLGLVVTFDLGQGFETLYESRARGFEAVSAERRAAHQLRELKALQHDLQHDLRLLHELIHDADRDVQKAERFLQLTRDEYNRGVKNGPDMRGALEKLFEFRERRTALFREYYESDASLSALMERAQ